MFTNRSIKTKVIAMCGLLACVTAGVGGLSYLNLRRVSTEYHRVATVSLPKVTLANEMFLEYRRIRILLRTLGLPGVSKTEADQTVKDALESIAEYEDMRKSYLADTFEPGEKELFEKTDLTWSAFKQVGQRVLDLHKSGKPADHEEMVRIFLLDCPARAKEFTAAIQGLLKYHKDNSEVWVERAESIAAQANTEVALLILAGFALSMVCGFWFANALGKTLRAVVRSLESGSGEVAAESQRIATASSELSASATEQAAALQETVSAVDEVNAMVTKNADNAQRSLQVSGSSQTAALQGKKSVDEMIHSMGEISDANRAIMEQTEASNREIAEIVKVIEEIGAKTKVINDIVFQTKLLSFNASVEAARAGEHGKGFAVVAEEVGNLAQMSGNAAKEISSMLEGSVHKVEGIVNNTRTKITQLVETGKAKVQSGTLVAKRCGEVLEGIVASSSELTQMVEEVATASREQSQGIQEITKAMAQLDQVTQRNAAVSQQSAEASEKLTTQAKDMRGVVDTLLSTVDGGPAPVPATSTANAAAAAKVLSFRSRSARPAPVTSATRFQKAVGSDLPDGDDSRFEEI